MSGNLMAVSQKSTENACNSSNGPRGILVLFIMGIFIIFLGVAVLITAAMLSGSGSASFGGFIFIGPIPIIIGAGPEAPWLTAMAVILTIIGIVVFLIMRRRMGKPNG
jgi:uncharacterized membrane protein